MMAVPDRFSSLPPEFRNAIYELVIPANLALRWRGANGIRFFTDTKFRANREVASATYSPGILAVSKSVRNEALPIFYKSAKFRIDLAMREIHAFTDFMSRFVEKFGPSPFQHVTVHLDGANGLNFRDVKPLVDLMHLSGLHRNCISISMRERQRKSSGLQSVLNEALDIGCEASEDGWNAMEMTEEFRWWMSEVSGRMEVKLQTRAIRNRSKQKSYW